jgi:hypothetical protein
MSQPGASENVLVTARAALLDALEALEEQRDAVTVVGAQAVYLRTGGADVALAEATKDSDLAIDPRELRSDPRIEVAMERAGFYPNPFSNQPGAWNNPAGIPVDLMVPEDLAGPGGRNARAARIPPHDKRSTRRARGLEATIVDHPLMTIAALDPADRRSYEAQVAGPAALIVAKLHKIGERENTPTRLVNKDAHDLYRILRAVSTEELVAALERLLHNDSSRKATEEAMLFLERLFSTGPEALGSVMAGQAEEGIGDPTVVAASASYLAADVLDAVKRKTR